MLQHTRAYSGWWVPFRGTLFTCNAGQSCCGFMRCLSGVYIHAGVTESRLAGTATLSPTSTLLTIYVNRSCPCTSTPLDNDANALASRVSVPGGGGGECRRRCLREVSLPRHALQPARTQPVLAFMSAHKSIGGNVDRAGEGARPGRPRRALTLHCSRRSHSGLT